MKKECIKIGGINIIELKNSLTLKQGAAIAGVVVSLTLFVYLVGNWATYPTIDHRIVAQKQKDFLDRNGFFSGDKEYEDLRNTPQATYSKTAGSISSFVYYIFYISVLVAVYRYVRRRSERVVFLTTVISVISSVVATAIVVLASGNLDNVTLPLGVTLVALTGSLFMFTIITLFVVWLIKLVHYRRKKIVRSPLTIKGSAYLKSSEVANKADQALLSKRYMFGTIGLTLITLSVLTVSVTDIRLFAQNLESVCAEYNGDCVPEGPGANPSLSTASVPTTVSLKALNADRPEGNQGTTSLTFEITRGGDVSGTSIVDWSVQSGINPVSESGTVNFRAGENSRIFTISIATDTNPEPDRSFTVCLTASTDAVILENNICARGVVRNDDKTMPCGYAAGFTVTSACTAAAINRGNDMPIATTVRITASLAMIINNVVNRSVDSAKDLIGAINRANSVAASSKNSTKQVSAPTKILVTIGDSYEVGVPKSCTNMPNILCKNLLTTILNLGVIKNILNAVINTCGVQDYTSSNLTTATLSGKTGGARWSANNVTCAGSKTTQMIQGWNWPPNGKVIPSQLNALNASNVGLVVVSAGGNDMLLPESNEQSLLVCAGVLLCDANSELAKSVDLKADKLLNEKTGKGALMDFYEAIYQKTKAPVVVQGYPVYFGPKQYTISKGAKSGGTIQHVNEAPGCKDFEDSERVIGGQLEKKLNGRIEYAVKLMNKKYNTNQFIYVNPFAPGRYDYNKDHICKLSTAKPITGPQEFAPYPAHPNGSGVQRRSNQVLEAYNNYINQNNPLVLLTQ